MKRDLPLGVLFIAAALAVQIRSLGSPIHGHYYFRQAHVAANIEQYVANGLSLRPETFNRDIPYSLFDFPAYQLLVAAVVRATGTPPLATARAASMILFLLTALLIGRILAACGIRRLHRNLTVFFFCFLPLNLFYFHCPMVDCLAVFLSLASLYGYLVWTGSPSRPAGFLLLVSAGMLATLIKSPVYLPVFLGVLMHAAMRERATARRMPMLLFVLAMGSTVAGYKLFANRVNAVEGFFDASEPLEYFGPLGDRFDARSWSRIGSILVRETETPVVFGFTVLGFLLYFLRARGRYRALFLGLPCGSAVSLLVFFHRFTWHNYYQLIFGFPLAFFAAYPLVHLNARVRLSRRQRPYLSRVNAAALVAAGAVTFLFSFQALRELQSTPTDWIEASGEWIREHTAPDDFVVYVVDSIDPTDWNPVFLYFAKRYGYNLTSHRLQRHPEVLSRIARRFSPAGRFLVFSPASRPDLEDAVLSAGGRLLEAGPPGRIYTLEDALPADGSLEGRE